MVVLGRSWSFVVMHSRSWSFVVVRGRSRSFVVVRGLAWSLMSCLIVRGRASPRPTHGM